MDAYDLLDVALKISLGTLAVLIVIVCLMLIIKYIRIIADHALERKLTKEEAEKMAKNIYGED